MAVPKDGIYQIATVSDPNFVWDVDNSSMSDVAELFIYSKHNNNNQKFVVKTMPAGYSFIYIAHSLKVVDGKSVNASNIKNLDDIIQYSYHGGVNQQWYITDTVSKTGIPCHYVETAVNRVFVADNSQSYLKDRNNVILYQKHTEDNQRWVFNKTAYLNTTMPTPSDVGVGSAEDLNGHTTYDITAVPQTIYPMWKCEGENWQLRYRYRARKVGESSYGDWQAWRTLSGLTTDDGWGDIWSTNCKANGDGITKKATEGLKVSIDQVQYDRYEYQIAVRSFGYRSMVGLDNIAQSGNTATGTITLNYMPTLSINSFVLTGRGIVIEYASDFKRPNNTFTFDLLRGTGRRKLTVKESIFSDKDYTGTVLIPFSGI